MAHERRRDEQTSSNISDALRAQGSAAAQAMDYQQVRFETALRVLTRPAHRREQGGR
jgi:hypothetical protein